MRLLTYYRNIHILRALLSIYLTFEEQLQWDMYGYGMVYVNYL